MKSALSESCEELRAYAFLRWPLLPLERNRKATVQLFDTGRVSFDNYLVTLRDGALRS
jgi:hypothetical protein